MEAWREATSGMQVLRSDPPWIWHHSKKCRLFLLHWHEEVLLPISVTSPHPLLLLPSLFLKTSRRRARASWSQRGAPIAVWAVGLLSCSRCSGSHHNIDFCQRHRAASHVPQPALITFDQLRLESSFNPFWEKIAKASEKLLQMGIAQLIYTSCQKLAGKETAVPLPHFSPTHSCVQL